MASDLETEMRSAVKNGFLELRMWRSWDGKLWNCEYRTTDSTAIQKEEDVDLPEALKKVLRAGTRENKKAEAARPRRSAEDLA